MTCTTELGDCPWDRPYCTDDQTCVECRDDNDCLFGNCVVGSCF